MRDHQVCDGASRVLVFCAAKRGCEGLKAAVRRQGFAAETLHGDKTQQVVSAVFSANYLSLMNTISANYLSLMTDGLLLHTL